MGTNKKFKKKQKIRPSGQPAGQRQKNIENMSKNQTVVYFWSVFVSKKGRKKIEIEGVGPIWRGPRRNSAELPAGIMQNGWMATQLVTKRCDLGSLGVPGPASTPKPICGGQSVEAICGGNLWGQSVEAICGGNLWGQSVEAN